MKESGLRPYNWTGLSYNAWRNVVPKRRLEWLGYETVHLEKKKPNQHWVKMKDGDTNFDTGTAQKSDYSDMIYTADAQCMQSRYQTSRYEKNMPEFSFPPWKPPIVEPPVEPELPSAPTGLSATTISTTEIDLAWNIVDGALSYYIYRDGVFLIATTSLTYNNTGLTEGTTYSYQVSAVGIGGEGAKCSAVSATTYSSATSSGYYYSLDGTNWYLAGALSGSVSGEYIVLTLQKTSGGSTTSDYFDNFVVNAPASLTGYSDTFTGADDDPPNATNWENVFRVRIYNNALGADADWGQGRLSSTWTSEATIDVQVKSYSNQPDGVYGYNYFYICSYRVWDGYVIPIDGFFMEHYNKDVNYVRGRSLRVGTVSSESLVTTNEIPLSLANDQTVYLRMVKTA